MKIFKRRFDYLTLSARTASPHFYGEYVTLDELVKALDEMTAAAEKLDRLKKLMFYSENQSKGVFKTPMSPVTPTARHASTVLRLALYNAVKSGKLTIKHGDCHTSAVDLLHGIVGIATETGEITAELSRAIRLDENKIAFSTDDFDIVNLIEEIGDLRWYEAMICRACGWAWNLADRLNIKKLMKRFPNRFTSGDANVRDLKAERKVLDNG